MPTSATGSSVSDTGMSRSAEQGFTLLELMVVVAIVGLASAAVVVALPDPRGRVIDEADRLAVRAKAVQDDAIVQGRAISLRIDASGYAVERRIDGQWQAAGERLFAPVGWKQGTLVSSGGRATFDPTGAIGEPVTVELRRDTATARVTLSGDGGIRVGK